MQTDWRSGLLILSGAGAMLALVLVGGAAYGREVAAEREAAQAACADAVQRVQEYKAPGQTVPLRTTVAARVGAERRPVHIEGWEPVNPASRTLCYVTFRARIGNERTRLTWSLDPKTGEIKAFNDAARRYSGW